MIHPPPPAPEEFPAFFRELWGSEWDPFPWQTEFAARLCGGRPPDYVAAPTGSGKTACLDAAVFALAVQAGFSAEARTQGRRIFFIVNRRIIVDEAYERAGILCRKLREAPAHSVVGRVAAALRRLGGDPEAPPLTRARLHGGAYRDRQWASSLLQPMIVCSTIDQAGSRLLFRGYGVSPQARPIHAALVAQDSLLLLDEAHISRPFVQTLEWVKRFRVHRPAGSEVVELPFTFVQMTATPPAGAADDRKITLGASDQEHPILRRRLGAPKPARLVVEAKAKGQARGKHLAARLVAEAEALLARHRPRSLAIMVNRVATAREVERELRTKHGDRVILVIGRLRPVDREDLTKRLQDLLKTGGAAAPADSEPHLVVSTQCLEVGADLDFDALVTEAASLDALRQRFGRLNRGGRTIPAPAVIVLPGELDLDGDKLDDTKPCDPIYGNAIPRTWRWLESLAKDGVVDFGVNAMTAAVGTLPAGTAEQALAGMSSQSLDAPVLLPAYLDCWAQTHPAPAADPDVGLFLHGPQRDMAEVQVCWRGDLPDHRTERDWTEILSLCPPTTAECLPVPLHVFRAWLSSQGAFDDPSGDVPEAAPVEQARGDDRGVSGFVWRGTEDGFFAANPSEILPGDTVVLRAQTGGWRQLGHIPGAKADASSGPGGPLGLEDVRRLDVAEAAAATARRRAVLRIHPGLWGEPEPRTPAEALWKMSGDRERDWPIQQIQEALRRLLTEKDPGWALTGHQQTIIRHLAQKGVRLSAETYPGEKGMVLSTPDLLPAEDREDADEIGEGEADALLEATRPQELWRHTQDVLDRLEATLASLPLEAFREALTAAAGAHDWGKADMRFQAWLRGATPFAAMASGFLLAKSGALPASLGARRAARRRATLPEGFRHELLSAQMAASPAGAASLPARPEPRALALHLITTHHGYARPLAPLVLDEAPPEVRLQVDGREVGIPSAERLEQPAHAIHSGVADRFWEITRRHGWWGAALLEAALRLADQTASAKPGTFRMP